MTYLRHSLLQFQYNFILNLQSCPHCMKISLQFCEVDGLFVIMWFHMYLYLLVLSRTSSLSTLLPSLSDNIIDYRCPKHLFILSTLEKRLCPEHSLSISCPPLLRMTYRSAATLYSLIRTQLHWEHPPTISSPKSRDAGHASSSFLPSILWNLAVAWHPIWPLNDSCHSPAERLRETLPSSPHSHLQGST